MPARLAAQGGGAVLTVLGASGLLQTRDEAGAGAWVTLEKPPAALQAPVALRTGRKSTGYLRLADGVTLLLQEDSVVTVEDLRRERALARLDVGVAVVAVRRGAPKTVQLRTPSAALTLRGGEARVVVLAGGRTSVELSEGEAGVEDNRGHQALLRAGESVQVDLRGLEVPRRLPAASEVRREGLRGLIRHEAEADAFRERLHAASADGQRRQLWEEGRVLVDAGGRRVRAESWLRRPRADQLELVTLNGRPGRTDYHYFLATFSSRVPDDPAGALRAVAGTVGAAPGLTLTAYESVRSNGPDTVRESGEGGHLVDLNANADGADDVSAVFDPVSGRFVSAAGASAWRSLFDRWGLYIDGRLAAGRSGANIQADSDATPTTNVDPFSGAALTAANALLDPGGGLATKTVSVTHPVPGSARQTWSWSFSDGSGLSLASTALAAGAAAPGTLPASGGASAFRSALPGRWLDQGVSSSLFSGRRIDLTLDPALAVTTGLVP